jgi:hypothetical protein
MTMTSEACDVENAVVAAFASSIPAEPGAGNSYGVENAGSVVSG